MPKQDGQIANVVREHSSQGRGEGPIESWTVRALKRVVVGAVVARVCMVAPALAHVALIKPEPSRQAVLAKAPALVYLWFKEVIESA